MALVKKYSAAERAERERIRRKCRANRHDMELQAAPPPEWQMPASLHWRGAKYHLHKLCQECGTWRHMAVAHNGADLASYYDWPDWYRQDPGEGRMSSGELRLWEVDQVKAMSKPKKLRRVV
jgi:hypothetical protein